MMRNITKHVNRTTIFGMVLLIGLWLFLIFNMTTTLETLNAVLGTGVAVTSFAIGVSIVDFAGLARVFVPIVSREDEDSLSKLLFVIWLVAAISDMILTAWWVDMRIVNTALVEGLFGQKLVPLFPWILAFAEFSLRVPLVILAGGYLEYLFRRDNVRVARRPEHVMGIRPS